MNNSEYIKREYDKISEDYEKHKVKKSFYDNNIVKFLKKYINNKKSVIDIGCGTGIILRRLNPKYGVGVDISDGMIKKANEYNQNNNLRFFVDDAENLKIKEKFDFVTLIDIFPYVEECEKVLMDVKKLCKKDSRVIIFYFNPLFGYLVSLLESLRLKAPDPINRDFRSKKELIKWLEDTNYNIEYEGYTNYLLSVVVVAKPK